MFRHLARSLVILFLSCAASPLLADDIGVGAPERSYTDQRTATFAGDDIGVGLTAGDDIGVGMAGDDIGVGSDAEWYVVIAEWFGTDDR